MNIKPFNHILCRTPVFSINDTLEDRWEELKALIQSSSPAFYALIEKFQPKDLAKVDEKLRFTIWKYFNRCRFRSTPFGAFAATAILPLGPNGSAIQLSKELTLHEFNDWSNKDQFTKNISEVLKNSKQIIANSTCYRIGGEIRYIRMQDEGFELNSVISFPELISTLDLCVQMTSLSSVYGLLDTQYHMTLKQAKKFVGELLSIDLLLTDYFPNITGVDYFHRIGKTATKSAQNYGIASRKVMKGTMDQSKLDQIPELIQFLSQISPIRSNPDLEEFKNRFTRKFGQDNIPLGIAMDPEIGIGYGDLATSAQDSELIQYLVNQSKHSTISVGQSYSDFHHFLLEGIIAGKPIHLENFTPQGHQKKNQLPNTFSVLCNFSQDSLVIEQIGGCTANALLGRFTLACEQTEELAKQIAGFEEKANPGITFFDVAYQAEKKVDNVNRRKILYQAEIPINSWSTQKEVLALEDILVSQKGGEIWLECSRTGKRIVPRIPSAYNYSRSDLGIYRFLCDLQHQHLQSTLSFDINTYYPRLGRYPRVYYKQIIVSPARWLLPKEFCRAVPTAKNPTDQLPHLKKWLGEQSVPALFRTGEKDLTLTFNSSSEEDLKALLSFARKTKIAEIYLSESAFQLSDCIQDNQGNHYLPQYIATYGHDQPIYAPSAQGTAKVATELTRDDIHLPADNWIYLEVYCHPNNGDQLLQEHIGLFLRKNRCEIKKWFFIRYTDPGPHLRVRIEVKESRHSVTLIKRLMELFDPLVLNRTIHDLQLKTYFPEIQRYGLQRIALVEQFFHLDSEYILRQLPKLNNDEQRYSSSIQFIKDILKLQSEQMEEQIELVKDIAGHFCDELSIDQQKFKKINAAYRKLQTIPRTSALSKQLTTLLLKILDSCDNELQRRNLAVDLIHMHVNRLFAANQRIHEAILYQYLLIELRTELALAKHQPAQSVRS